MFLEIIVRQKFLIPFQQTLTTIKKEVAELLPPGQAPGSSNLRELSKKLEGVDKLLVEPKIQSMISSISGKDINNLIGHTLRASGSNRQAEALTIGLQSIQSILAKSSTKSPIDKDLAMSFASLVRK